MQLKIGDQIKQVHWNEGEEWVTILKFLPNERIEVSYIDPDHPGLHTTDYPVYMKWVKRVGKQSEKNWSDPCSNPECCKQPLPANALARFPSHPSDILIHLADHAPQGRKR